ncbi:prephenate dehydrogenase [Streptomyces sp. NPDC021098]|uniref:prephenate dehydrogenase n=1 Tax=unclassified Streptomyces TaxID=2593676 RepID=UPI00378FEBE5
MVNSLSADNSVGSTIEALKAELPQLEKQHDALKGDLDAVAKRLEVVSTALSSLQALSGAALPQSGNGDIAEAKAAGDTVATATDAATEADSTSAADAAPATRTPAATRKAAIGRQRSKAKSTAGSGRAAKTATKAAAKKTATKKPAKKAAAKDTSKTTAKATTKAAKATEKSAQTSEKATAPAKATAPKATAKAAAPKATEKTAKAAGTSSERSTGLAESVLGALKKAGRPMRASEVNEALGRDETRTNVNSVRNTLERLRTTDRAKRSGRGLYEAAATS